MRVKAASPAPNWQEAFGTEAEVNFHAWAVARYVGQVAAAGKAVYPLPMYANAALRDPLKPGPPGTYESGGPTDNVLDIWKAEAPALDVLAPDNYTNDPVAYLKVLESITAPTILCSYRKPAERIIRASSSRLWVCKPSGSRRLDWTTRGHALRQNRPIQGKSAHSVGDELRVDWPHDARRSAT